MSKALTFILIHKLWLFLIFLIVLILLTAPGAVALYHQVRGGLLLEHLVEIQSEQSGSGFGCFQMTGEDQSLKVILQESIQHLSQASDHGFTEQRASLLLARAYCLQDGPRAAIPLYQESILLNPDDPLRHLKLAMAYDQLAWENGNHADLSDFHTLFAWVDMPPISAVEPIQQALAQWQAAGSTSNQFLLSGDELLGEEDYEQALRWYLRALWMDPGNPAAWQKIGQVYQTQGKWQEASMAYQKAWEKDPENTVMNMVLALQNLGELDSVDSILQQALEDYLDSSQRQEWIRLLGESLVEQEKWEEAQVLYTQAIEEFPEHSLFYISLGWVIYENLGDDLYARYLFQQAVEINPEQAGGYAAIGQLLGRERRFAEADEWFRQAIEKNPQQSYYYLLRANNLRNAGEVQQSIEQYLQIIELFPDETEAYYHLAWAYKMNDQSTQAIEAIEKAIQLSSSQRVNYYLRAAAIYEWADEIQKAIEAFERVLRIEPDNQDAIEGIERLR